MEQTVWHTKTAEDIVSELGTSIDNGLSGEEAKQRIEKYGFNTLEEKAKRSPIVLFLSQFNDFMIWVLIVAALVSGILLREAIEGLAIVAILFLNAVLGFVQEYRAEKALEALKSLSAPESRVIRGGVEEKVPSYELVPGDIIILEAGDIVPADARISFASAFLVNEAPLTGESVASTKTAGVIPNPDIPIGDRDNMAFSGTVVFSGRAKAIVTQTGPRTEIGKIAELVQTEEEKTPLQIELRRIGKNIAIIVLVVAVIIFTVGLLRGFNAVFVFLAAVSLAVAAIPEGLPAIVTATLALGVQAMAAQNAIIRKLHAVETLGSTTVICTDKTGTLTLNQMTATKLYLDDHVFDVKGETIVQEEAEISVEDLSRLIEIATLANDARYGADGKLIGDPTETALIRLADNLGYPKEKLEAQEPRIDEIPFDSERKRMTTINKANGGFLVLIKGAPESVLPLCVHERSSGKEDWLSSERREEILKTNSRLASEGFRTLAFAYKFIEEKPGLAVADEANVERDLVFTGLVGLTDPPRPEVPLAIEIAKQAGIRIAMITGDHKLTATAVAKEIGLLEDGVVMTGAELEKITEAELSEIAYKINVYARVDPSHKVKIVAALKDKGDVVAMTGDGVNDAPAVKRADIGISMGITGTEVTKEASDMILADDNFATIVRAVREGRLIFDNLKKFILYLLSCNASEVFAMFIALMIGLPIPLLPIQILWTNLITDGLPALALGVDPPAHDLMKRPPRKIEDAVLARSRLTRIAWQGFLLTVAILSAFVTTLLLSGAPLFGGGQPGDEAPVALAQTVAFTTMVSVQLLHSLNYRTATTSMFSREIFRNKFLLLAIVGSFALQLAVIYVPFLQPVFNTRPLDATQWVVVLLSIIPILVIVDVTKTRNTVGRF